MRKSSGGAGIVLLMLIIGIIVTMEYFPTSTLAQFFGNLWNWTRQVSSSNALTPQTAATYPTISLGGPRTIGVDPSISSGAATAISPLVPSSSNVPGVIGGLQGVGGGQVPQIFNNSTAGNGTVPVFDNEGFEVFPLGVSKPQ